LTVQQRGQRNLLGDDFREVLTEKEGTDVVVLVLNDVVDNGGDCSVLIGFKSKINNISIIVLLILFRAFIELIPIENGVVT
jgi:hypothetical protein